MSRQRGLLVALMALVLGLVAVAPADAGRRWCEKDPVFQIAGRQVNVVVTIPEDFLPAVTGPIAVTLYVPIDASALLISTDEGYNGYGEAVSIVPASWLKATERSVQIRVEVTVPASSSSMPVKVYVTPAGARSVTGKGRANKIVPVHLALRTAA